MFNKQTKLAFFIAPFLVIGGYIASDQYIVHKSDKGRLFSLILQNQCRLFSDDCILESGDILINLTDKAGVTQINSSFPLNKAAVSLVLSDNNEIIYELEQASNPQFWQRKTAIREAHLAQQSLKSLRIMVKIRGDLYLSELDVSAIER